MADKWFFAHDELRKGPFSGQQMKDMASCGEILPTDTVWKEGVAKSVSANKVKYLFQPGQAVSAPEASTPPDEGVAASAEALAAAVLLDAPAPAAEAKESSEETTAPDGRAEQPKEKAPATTQPAGAQQNHVKKGRAVAGKGAIIQGQDGVQVKFRKKCTVCGHEDSSWTTIPIRNGVIRSPFYCRKCRKSRDVEIQGYLH